MGADEFNKYDSEKSLFEVPTCCEINLNRANFVSLFNFLLQ